MSKNSKLIIILWIIACAFSVVLSLFSSKFEDNIYLYYSGFLEFFTAFSAAFLCYHTMTAFEYTDLSRKAWGFLSTGLVLWSAGSALYTFYLFSYGVEAPFPWYSDIGYLMLFPFAIASLITFRKRLDVPTPRWGTAVSIIVFALALTLGVILNVHALKEHNIISVVVTSLYVVLYPLMLSMTVSTASVLAGGMVGRPWWFVLAGLSLFYIGDIIYTFLGNLDEIESQGSVFLDLTWPVACGLISTAAMMTRSIFKEFNQ